MAGLNINWIKVGKVAKVVAIPLISGIGAAIGALNDQKKAEEYETMKKAFEALNQNKED